MASAILAPYQQNIKILSGNNNNNFANGVQNIRKGRDFLQNTFTGQINVNNRGRDDSDDDDDDNEDRPFPPRKFQKALKLFKQQYLKVSDNNAFEKADRQQYLDRWQHLILSDLPDKAKLTQLSSCRELLGAHLEMKTNTNRLKRWRTQQSNATYHQIFNNTSQSSKNHHNFASGVQNFYKGRDFNQNSGAGRIVVNYNTQGGEDEDDGDRPLSPEKFQKELKIFKRLYPRLRDNELKKIHSQEYLDRWQPPVTSNPPGKMLFPSPKTDIVDVMERFPNVSGLSLKCLRIQQFGIKDLNIDSNAQSADLKVSEGNAVAIAKAPEKETSPDEEPPKCDIGESEPGEPKERSKVKKLADVSFDRFANFLLEPPDVARIAEPLGLVRLLSKATDETLESGSSGQCGHVLYYEMHNGGDTMQLKNPPTRPDPKMPDKVWNMLQE